MTHRYIALTQSPYCCVPTVLLMILMRRKLPLLQIEDIGCDLGLAVPEDVGHLYPNARIGARPSSGFGTEVQNPKYTINSFLERNNYSLQETYYPNHPSGEKTTWLADLYQSNADIIVCFNNSALFGGESDWGHVCLIDSLNGDSVVLIDPEARQPKFRTVKLERLYLAIVKHGEGNRGGFWVIQ